MSKHILIMNDFFDKGGVPSDYRNWVHYYNRHAHTKIFVNNYKIIDKNVNIDNYLTFTFLTFFKLFNKHIDKDDYVLIFSFFSIYSIFASLLCILKKIKYVLVPLNQINDEVFSKKIFIEFPEIKSLESTKTKRVNCINRLLITINPFLKKLMFVTIGKFMVKNSSAVGVFSNFEKNEIKKRVKYKNKYVIYRWGINPQIKKLPNTNFFIENFKNYENKINYVYWGRLDFYFKGLDLLIEAVKHIKLQIGKIPFRIYLMGPDYQNSVPKIDSLIKKYNLEEDIIRCGPDLYISKEKIPLREADVSIYLSRWDGFPRTIKESMFFGVPVIVTEPTHFGDNVRDDKLGYVVNDLNNIAEIADGLLKMTSAKLRNNFSNNCLRYIHNLYWENVVNDFYKNLVS